MDLDLKDRKVLVTAGTAGTGLAILRIAEGIREYGDWARFALG